MWGVAIAPQFAPDGVFSGDNGPSLLELVVDDSGVCVDMSSSPHRGSFAIYEPNSTRADLIDTRTVDFVCSLNDTDTGYLWFYHDARMELITGGVISLRVNGTQILSHTIANLTAATVEDFVISWATEPNTPFTTGASDAYRSELHIFNLTLGTYETATATHAVQLSPGGGGATFLWGAADIVGGNEFSGTMTKLRLSSAFHSSTETREVYVTQSEPTAIGETRLDWPVPERSTGFGDDAEFDGPIRMMVVRGMRSSDLRLVGPAINELGTGAWAEDSTWTIPDPIDADYDMHLEWIFRRPIPVHCDRVHVRAHVQQNSTSQIAVSYRLYASNRPGPLVTPEPSQSTSADVVRATVLRNADDGANLGGGAWIDFGSVRVARDGEGYCYFWLGFDTPGGSEDYRIKALVVEPIIDDSEAPIGGGGIGGVIG